MNDDSEVLSAESMQRTYGEFWKKSPRVKISRERVPEEVHDLIPYAEFWGISDDWTREALIKSSPKDLLKNMKMVVKRFEEIWEPWLAGPEASNPSPSDEYVAFSALVMAADYVEL